MSHVKIQTVAKKIEERLRSDIINGFFLPGERVTIKELSERYGVSAMPVREAFQTLKGEKFLEMLPYKGAVILSVNKDYVRDIFEINALIQSHFSAKALACGLTQDTKDKIEALYQELNEYKGTEDTDEFMDLNLKFHRLFLLECGNEKAFDFFDEYSKISHALRRRYTISKERMQQIRLQHAEIMKCLRENNADGLRKAILLHRGEAGEDVVRAINWED